MKRYDLVGRKVDGYAQSTIEERKTGAFVKYEDYEEVIAKLEKLVKAIIQYDDCDTAGQSRRAQEWMIKLAKQLNKVSN